MAKKTTEFALVKADKIAADFPVLQKREDVAEVLRDNFPRGLSTEDLLRVKFSGGGSTQFEIVGKGDTPMGEVDEIVGLVAYHTPTRVRWNGSMDDPDRVRGLPLCASSDGVTGEGKPGGPCHSCEFQRWTDEGKMPECDSRRAIFLLQPGEWLPLSISLPRKSQQAFEAFLARLSAKCISIYGMLVRFSLKKEKNALDQVYSLLEVESVGQLTPSDLALSRDYRKTMEESLKAVATEQPNDPSTASEERSEGRASKMSTGTEAS